MILSFSKNVYSVRLLFYEEAFRTEGKTSKLKKLASVERSNLKTNYVVWLVCTQYSLEPKFIIL